jgi:iron(III) transport system substrate-binding protein
VLIPGPAAIFGTSKNPVAAKAFLDLLLSPEGQARIVKGDMHSADPRSASPAGAPPWSEVFARGLPWSEALLERIEADAAGLRTEFNRRVQR